jgi:hypothetical protein
LTFWEIIMKTLLLLTLLLPIAAFASDHLRGSMESIDQLVFESLREKLQEYAKSGDDDGALWYLDAIVRSKHLPENPEIEVFLSSKGLRYLDSGSVSDVLESAYLEYLMGVPIHLERIIENENLKHDKQKKPAPLRGEDGEIVVLPKENRISGSVKFGRYIHYGIEKGKPILWGYEIDRGWYRIAPWEVGGTERYKELLNDAPLSEEKNNPEPVGI